jgi:phage recombination protein Bet
MEVAYRDLNDNEITLTPQVVKKYICNNSAITDSEMAMFLKLCQHQQLNPFLREVYLIKYGSQPATMVTGKETFLKRAKRDPRYAGHECSIEGKIPEMSATAKVYVQGYQVPITCTVWYEEYVGTKKDGTPTAMWANKPRTMLAKVALVQALREAFPDTFGGMYSQEEINTVDADNLPTADIVVEKPVVTETVVTEIEQPEEPVSAELNDGEDVQAVEIQEVTATEKINEAAEKIREEFGSTTEIIFDDPEGLVKRVGPNSDIELGPRPERPSPVPGSCTPEYAEYLLNLFKAKIEGNMYLSFLEENVDKPLCEWSLLTINLLEDLGKSIMQNKVSFDEVFGKYFK